MSFIKNTYQRSPLFYVGDKYKLLPSILSHFPEDIATFIEPFVGGGSVFLNVSANQHLINDANSHIIELHELLRSHAKDADLFLEESKKIIYKYGLSRSFIEDVIPAELKKASKKTYYARYNKEAYMNMRRDYNASVNRNVHILYLLLIYGFNRMIRFNSKGDFNLPVGNVDFNTNTQNALYDYFHKVTDMNLKMTSMDFEKFIRKQQISKQDFIYFDPPYLITSSEYNKIWNTENEHRLLDLIDEMDADGFRFAISNVTLYKGLRNELFDQWSQKYFIHEIKSNYISYHDNSIKDFTEVLVTNQA